MKSFLMSTVLAAAVIFLSVAELGFINNAEAIIGMWLLVVQGLLVNAYVGVREGSGSSERDNSGGNPREPLSVRDALQELPGSRISPFPGDGSEAGEIARGIPATRRLAEKENQILAEKRLDLSLA